MIAKNKIVKTIKIMVFFYKKSEISNSRDILKENRIKVDNAV